MEKRAEDLRHLTERARENIEERILLRSFSSYQNWMKTADDLEKHVMLFLNAAEVYDEQLGWIERKDPFDAETRPTRLRMRLPSEFGGRGNPLNHANLERLMKVALNAQLTLPKLLPPGLQLEEQADQRDALTIVTPDKGQIAELSAGFGKLVEKLVERTEERRIERGLNVFGEKIEEPPPLDAPGRDMLELDNERPLADDEVWETVTVTVDDDLPQGVYRNEEGEILPIEDWDGEGGWDSGDE